MKDFFKLRNIAEENGAGDTGTPSLVSKYKNETPGQTAMASTRQPARKGDKLNAKDEPAVTEGLRDPKDNPCWKGYEPIGTKKKNGRTVPNCVPKEETVAEADTKFINSLNKLAQTQAQKNKHKVGDSVTVNSKFFGKQKGKITKIDNQSIHVQRNGKETSEKYPHDAVMKENVNKSDVPAYLRKQKGEKPLTVADVKAPRKDSISAPVNLAKARNEEMSDDQMDKREKIVKGMKKNLAGFKARYGDRAKDVMYATATKQAMREAKDEKEYGYEGDMALNQLATLTRCAEMIKDIMKPDTDLPEWVQSKITLATDYIVTAADYLYSELKEETSLDEISDTLKTKYANKVIKKLGSRQGTRDHDAYIGRTYTGRETSDMFSRGEKLDKHLQRVQKIQKEETELDEATNKVDQLRAALARHSEKAIAANKNGDHDAVKVHQNYMNKIKDKMAKAVRTESTVPFDGPYTKTPSNVKDKSGAIHTPMSRARDLARNAIRQQLAKKKDTKESVVPDHMRGKQKPYVSSDGKGNYEVLGNKGQTKATFSRATHGKDAHARAQQHLKNKYDTYMKEDLNELSNKTLSSYVDKAAASVHALDKAGQDNKADKRFDGVVKASDKMTTQAKRTRMSEDASYKVEVEGLPTMYINSKSPSEVKQNLRKIIKKADSILSVDRVMDADVRKAFRLKAAGKEEE
jgi:hypothetical protein